MQETTRQRMVAALAVQDEGEAALRLLDYLAERDCDACEKLIQLFAAEQAEGLDLGQLVRQMVASEEFSSIAEVHPAWILERLRGEPPRVVGLILRSLPSKHVRYLLDHLPPMLRDRIPNMVEAFGVAKPVLELIRRRFERHFLPMRVTHAIEHPGFEHLYFLKGEELEVVIRDLGLTELAIALSGMSTKALHLIFNRLSLKDAKRLQRRIRELKGISTELYRQARYSLLAVEGRHEGAERLLVSAGLAALACALGQEHGYLARLLQQKLAPVDGYLLKRFIDEHKSRFDESIAVERRGMIVQHVALLAHEERVSPQWARFAPEVAAPPVRDERASDETDPAIDEETGEVKALE
jgi:hypothetical protein